MKNCPKLEISRPQYLDTMECGGSLLKMPMHNPHNFRRKLISDRYRFYVVRCLQYINIRSMSGIKRAYYPIVSAGLHEWLFDEVTYMSVRVFAIPLLPGSMIFVRRNREF